MHMSGRPAKDGEGLNHVSGCEVDVGGGAYIQICTKLESEFLTGQDE